MGSQVTGQERELNLAWNLQVKKNMRKPWETNARSSKPEKNPCKNGSWQTKSCQTNDGRAYLPGQNAFKKNMRYELSLSLCFIPRTWPDLHSLQQCQCILKGISVISCHTLSCRLSPTNTQFFALSAAKKKVFIQQLWTFLFATHWLI